MSPTKRKATTDLQRRVKARRDSSSEPELIERGPQEEGTSDESENDHESQSDSDSDSEPNLPHGAAAISFGALAKAQATVSSLGKRRKVNGRIENDDGWENNEALARKAGRKDHRDFERSSKHAPTEISSKKAVSRKREVVTVFRRQTRDPRFEAAIGEVDESKIKRAYSFLDDYREDEMKELRTTIKATKDEDVKEKLKRKLLSMESKRKAQLRKDKEQEILDRHRKEEKELVKQGKQPFFLKKSEQKKRVLLDQYGELKGKQLDHVLERRRKKVESKEKKNLPWARRELGE